jgi:hypothetical protein
VKISEVRETFEKSAIGELDRSAYFAMIGQKKFELKPMSYFIA